MSNQPISSPCTFIKELFKSETDFPHRIICAKPVSMCTKEQPFIKIRARCIGTGADRLFHVEKFTATQVFHENLSPTATCDYIVAAVENTFRQTDIETAAENISILSGKKKRFTAIRKAKPGRNVPLPDAGTDTPSDTGLPFSGTAGQNRQKNYIISEGKPAEFLVLLGVMTPDGKVKASHYDKFRQINRFLEFIDDILETIKPEGDKPISIIDFGCGKSYLTFAVYYFLTELHGYCVEIIGLDLREDVIRTCGAIAEKLGYSSLKFSQGDIASWKGADTVDLVISLHACDTATDYAIAQAVMWQAKAILAVPCCQHELNRLMSENKNPAPELTAIQKYGILAERFAALTTDAMRAQLLESSGYSVQVLEFIDMTHTPKNILIRAVRKSGTQKSNEPAEAYENLKRLSGSGITLERLLFPKN